MSTGIERATIPDLRTEQCIALTRTTFRKSGQAVTTPVMFAERPGTIYVRTRAGSGKLKRLSRSCRVTLPPCTYGGFDATFKEIWLHAPAHEKCLAPDSPEGESRGSLHCD